VGGEVLPLTCSGERSILRGLSRKASTAGKAVARGKRKEGFEVGTGDLREMTSIFSDNLGGGGGGGGQAYVGKSHRLLRPER